MMSLDHTELRQKPYNLVNFIEIFFMKSLSRSPRLTQQELGRWNYNLSWSSYFHTYIKDKDHKHFLWNCLLIIN